MGVNFLEGFLKLVEAMTSLIMTDIAMAILFFIATPAVLFIAGAFMVALFNYARRESIMSLSFVWLLKRGLILFVITGIISASIGRPIPSFW